MKLLIASATAALLYSGATMAQAPSVNTAPATAEPPAMRLVTGNESKHAREADARQCLALKTDLAIIRCAEKYRYRPAPKTSSN